MSAADQRIDIDGVSVSPHHFIGGRRVVSATTFEARCPMDWDWKLADISRGDAETADQAVSAAVEGFGEWSAMSVEQRNAVLFRLADLIDANKDDFARVGIVFRDLRGKLFDLVLDDGFGDQFRGQGVAHVAFPSRLNAVRYHG